MQKLFKNRAEAISMLLAAFPASHSDPVTVARVYLMAIETCSDAAVFKIAKDYIFGAVRDQDRRFAPSVPDFATRCEARDRMMETSTRMLLKMDVRTRDETMKSLLYVSGPEEHAEMVARLNAADETLRISAGTPEDRDD